MYKKLYFGNTINNHWNILDILDENKKPTEYIAIRGEFWTPESELYFNELLKIKKIIGLSSYQNFPKFINNPTENRGPQKEEDIFINKYGNHVILWLHCFKDSINYIPPSIPKILYSETDQYPNVAYLNSIITKEKKYDFIASIQETEWNSWIRGLDIAKKWLNYMADEMKLKILVCGSNRKNDFSKNIDIIEFKPWSEFINIMNSAKYLFCSSRYDASPRIIIEAMSLNMPVLLNENILGGWKYINEETGMFFFYDEDIKTRVNKFINNSHKYNPASWVQNNVNVEKGAERLGITLSYLSSFQFENFVDKILFINLENRKDRLDEINNEFKKMNIHNDLIYRVDAIYDKDCGHRGCTLSHIKALKIAKENNWNRILILEDDFQFNLSKERVLFLLNTLYKNIDKWNVFMLGIGGYVYENTNINLFKRIYKGTTTSGYIVNNNYIDTLLQNYNESYKLLNDEVIEFKKNNNDKKLFVTSNALDQYWFKLQEKDIFLISKPIIGKQSDIASSIMNY